jgi:hypothetical protein
VLDRVVQTLALGDAEAAKILAEARDLSKPAPTTAPQVLKDGNKPPFYKAADLAWRRWFDERPRGRGLSRWSSW